MFVVYCSREPVRCLLDSAEVEFSYDVDISLVSVDLLMSDKELYRWRPEIMV
jgi:raffinose synthase